MKLWHSPASPFVRKVRIVAIETGLADRLELVEVATNVVDSDAQLRRVNPIGKIPALVLDSGLTLFDSRVISAYLDSLHGGDRLVPQTGEERYRLMTLEALGDGIMDAAVANRYETAMRPPELRWERWSEGQMAKVANGLDEVERAWLETLSGPMTIGAISVAAACGYLDFRYEGLDWRGKRPGLSKWFARFSGRESMQKTSPVQP